MFDSLEVIITFTCQFSAVLVQWFYSLAQAVMSQAESSNLFRGCLLKR